MKKFLIILTLAGATLGVTSCFSNEEPAGLEQMRGAKAELLSAQAAVQMAEVKIKEAQALKIAAETAYQEALNEAQILLNEAQEIENDYQRRVYENDLAEDSLALEKLKAEYERDIQKVMDEMEENALTHEAELLRLQKALLDAEEEYQKALIDLELAMALYADSKYIAELSSVVSQLALCRDEIANCNKEIAKLLNEGVRLRSLTAGQLVYDLKQDVKSQERTVELAQEKVDLLTEARDTNKVQFEKTMQTHKEAMDALVDAWTEYERETLPGEENALNALKKENAGRKYMLDGDKSTYESTVHGLDLEIDPALDPAYEVTLNPAPWDDFKTVLTNVTFNYAYDEVTFVPVKKYDAIEDARDAIGPEGTSGTLIEELKALLSSTLLTPTELADIENMIAQYELQLERYKADTAKAFNIYNSLRAEYIVNAADYGFDWTGVNDFAENHAYTKTLKALVDFYTQYKAKWEADPTYEPTDQDIKPIATLYASYQKKLVLITDNFSKDPAVDPDGSGKYVRQSVALTATASAYRETFFKTTMYAAFNPETYAKSIIGTTENLRIQTSLVYPAGPTREEAEKMYPSKVVKLLDAADELYGRRGIALADLLDPEMTVAPIEDRKPLDPATNYEDITPANYKGAPNEFVKFENVAFFEVNSYGNWIKNNISEITTGKVLDVAALNLVISDLKLIFNNQKDIAADEAAREKYIEDLITLYEKIDAECDRMQDAIDAAQEVINAEDLRLDEYEFENRVEVSATTGMVTSTYYSLAELEYDFHKDMYDAYKGYLESYDIKLSDGTSVTVTNIEEDIRTAMKDLEDELYDLKVIKIKLDAWLENGYDLESPITGNALDVLILENEQELENAKAMLEELQIYFDYLTEQKDIIISLMQSENI